jgi:DNA polymerase
MDNATRLQYLQAMGIEVWVSRNEAPVEDIQPIAEIDSQIEEQVEITDAIPDDWSVLQQEVAKCQRCDLHKTRTQTVFGAGNLSADWMFIGEAPGQNEDLEGKPFVGQAGTLLTEMIRAIGLQRDEVYIANILKCSPPDNRDPRVEEINTCKNYLQQQIEWVQPKIILAVGRIAAQTILETKEPLSKLRGIVHQLENIPLVVVYHPAYLLRSLPEKRKAWQDLQLAMKVYQEKK